METPPLDLEPAVCCVCGIEDVDPVGVGEDFEYRTCRESFLMVRCRQCGMVYLHPRPAASALKQIYPDHYHAFDFQPQSFGVVYRIRRWLEARRALSWCRELPDDARILDIGCGDGFHLRLLRDFGGSGWHLEGIDQDPRAVAAATADGLRVTHGSVESVSLEPASFDLILLIMTIEHVPDPVGLLRRIEFLLRPGGRVVVVTDNVASPDFTIFKGRHWGGYHFPRHFFLFSPATLRQAAELAGLDVDSLATPVSPVNWVYSLRNWLDDWGAPTWMVRQFSLKSFVALSVFTLWDLPWSLFGRGAILRGVFRRPLVADSRNPQGQGAAS